MAGRQGTVHGGRIDVLSREESFERLRAVSTANPGRLHELRT